MSEQQPPNRPTYTDEELSERIRYMSGKPLIYSNQYGMRFILSEKNEILLNISALIAEPMSEAGHKRAHA